MKVIYSFRHDASLFYNEFNSHLEEIIKIKECKYLAKNHKFIEWQ